MRETKILSSCCNRLVPTEAFNTLDEPGRRSREMTVCICLWAFALQDWDAVRAGDLVIRNEGGGWRAIRPETNRTVWYFRSTLGAKPPVVLDRGHVVLLAVEDRTILKLDEAGRILWKGDPLLPANQDPAAVLSNGTILVYGTGNYIWPADPDHSDYLDQSERRFIEARSIATGKLLWKRPLFAFGLPIFIQGNLMVTVRPKESEKWFLNRSTGDSLACSYGVSDGRLIDRQQIRVPGKYRAALAQACGDFEGFGLVPGGLSCQNPSGGSRLLIKVRPRGSRVELRVNGRLSAVLRRKPS